MTRIRVLPDARAELRAAASWYEKKREGLGAEFVAVVDATLQQIALQPEAAPMWRSDRQYRVKRLRRFPFTIFFRVGASELEVVAFAHQKRAPGYWVGR